MIRRHASTLRALLMLTDGVLAALVLVGLSVVRFGEDWAVWWRQIIPDPAALLVLYAVGWVLALAINGLYRPRARWSIRTEAWDLVRATVLMAVATFAVLFWFKLPDVSRLFLVLLFPTQFVVALVTRAILRLAFRELRARGRNARYVLVVGAGPRGQSFATTMESHQELGLKVIGVARRRSRLRRGLTLALAGTAGRHRAGHGRPRHRRGRHLPALQPVAVHRRHRLHRRGGGQDRARAHGPAGPALQRRSRGGAGRHAGLLARQRARPDAGPGGQAPAGHRCVARRG